ncbi:MAG TPA: FAD/NAD(P)-binding oxidoreductase [Candidatus Sulfotelmatobacter sp.]|nr:FAD/NAD(P)-binding oxidoreductase [Candidatus Sulfotelmatobacter sp.]
MSRESLRQFDVVVVGGGPAGIAAAVRAAQTGMSVGIVDDNPSLGGQIWRGANRDQPAAARQWLQLLQSAQVTTHCGMRVFHQPEPGILLAEGADDVREFRYKKLILATGARERFLPFPGWTLPNVMGAGGLQAMVKSGLPVSGMRVVVAGSGPLLLAVASYLRKHGSIIPVVCEQASWASLLRFSASLMAQPSKLAQAVALKKELAGIPFATSAWPLAAHGSQVLESVTISRRGKTETIACDYLACGFHLVPNTELAQLLGCQLSDGLVQVDEFQQTSVEGVFCAGEPTGIGGVEKSLAEGEIAGLTAANRRQEATRLFTARAKARRFARNLDRAYSLCPELKSVPAPDTLVCRCEDVSYSRTKEHSSWRSAKLHTRCGMGPCQGRVCGPATEFLFQWKPDSVRPPVLPVRVGSLAESVSQPAHGSLAVQGDHQ